MEEGLEQFQVMAAEFRGLRRAVGAGFGGVVIIVDAVIPAGGAGVQAEIGGVDVDL